MKNKITLLASSLLLGVILFIYVLGKTGFVDTISYFKEASIFPFIAYIIVSFFMMAIKVYRWQVILGAYGFKHSFWSLFAYKLAGFSLSYITPGAMVGGEGLRAYLLKRGSKSKKMTFTKSVSSIIIDKFFDLAVAAMLTSVGIMLVLSFFSLSRYLKAALLIVTVCWVVALSFFLYSSLTKKGFFSYIFRKLKLYKIKRLSKVEKEVKDTESNISHFFISHKKEFRRCVVLSFFLWLLMLVEYKIATAVLVYEASLTIVFLIILMVGFSYLFPLPGALGILEATQASMHVFIGFKAVQGLALSLLVRARDTMWTIIGLIFISHYGISLIKELAKNGNSSTK